MITLTKVSKTLAGRQVLTKVDYRIQAGEIHAWKGLNGSGKTTLARLVAGLEQPDSGEITRPDSKTLIFIAQQDFILWPSLSVRKNLNLVAPKTKWLPYIERFNLEPLLKLKAGRLSHGQKQMICLARALALEPGLLIVDEAISHLDYQHREQFLTLLTELNLSRSLAIIWIDHYEEGAQALGASTWELREERIQPQIPLSL